NLMAIDLEYAGDLQICGCAQFRVSTRAAFQDLVDQVIEGAVLKNRRRNRRSESAAQLVGFCAHVLVELEVLGLDVDSQRRLGQCLLTTSTLLQRSKALIAGILAQLVFECLAILRGNDLRLAIGAAAARALIGDIKLIEVRPVEA